MFNYVQLYLTYEFMAAILDFTVIFFDFNCEVCS